MSTAPVSSGLTRSSEHVFVKVACPTDGLKSRGGSLVARVIAGGGGEGRPRRRAPRRPAPGERRRRCAETERARGGCRRGRRAGLEGPAGEARARWPAVGQRGG